MSDFDGSKIFDEMKSAQISLVEKISGTKIADLLVGMEQDGFTPGILNVFAKIQKDSGYFEEKFGLKCGVMFNAMTHKAHYINFLMTPDGLFDVKISRGSNNTQVDVVGVDADTAYSLAVDYMIDNDLRSKEDIEFAMTRDTSPNRWLTVTGNVELGMGSYDPDLYTIKNSRQNFKANYQI